MSMTIGQAVRVRRAQRAVVAAAERLDQAKETVKVRQRELKTALADLRAVRDGIRDGGK